jgi:hypothetical protein
MLLAYDYPLLGLFWTILWFYLVFAWIMVVFSVVADIFRSQDMGGFAKALWLLAVIVVPLLGVIIYLVSNGDGMAARRRADAKAKDDAMRAYVQDAAGSSGPGDQLARLATLREQGTISEAEFESGKAKVLS